MDKKESAEIFFSRHGLTDHVIQPFNVFKIEDHSQATHFPYNRRDYYKIMLLSKASGQLIYGDRTISVNYGTLVFCNPMIPYCWVGETESVTGYFCLFTADFLNQHIKENAFSSSLLFKIGGIPVLQPGHDTIAMIEALFVRMLKEMSGDYFNRFDLLGSYLEIVIHESLKVNPQIPLRESKTSLTRLSSLFFDLLDRQFPIHPSFQAIAIKNANEFARQLSVHTNHLNKALREVTGKTTTQHLAERFFTEAKLLLANGDNTISEIAFSLGFEHASNFIGFFKRHSGNTPHQFRKTQLSF